MVVLARQMQGKTVKYIKSKIKKLKLFDWVLIVFGLVTLVTFVILFFRKSTYITATVSVGEDSVIYGSLGPSTWFANAFHKGQKEKDGLGRVQSEVLSVYSYDTSPNHKTVYLDVRLNSVYNRATDTYTYKGTSVLIGSTVKLNLDKIYAEGLITEVQGFPTHSKKQTIKIEAQIREENPTYPGTAGTKSYLADAIKIGDTIKDNSGSTLIKILDKKVVPAQITITTSDGRALSAIDPIKKDVTLTLEVLAENVEGKYYFLNNIPILIDQAIPLNTDTLSIFPTVTKFLTY